MTTVAGRGSEPGSEETRELSREDARAVRDDVSELVGESAVDEDEQEADDVLEIDQTELEELGLTLDDPHQPEPE
jgi:hypothetical protein